MSKILELYLEHVQGISDMQQFMKNYNRTLTVRDPLQHHIANELFIRKESDVDVIVTDFDTWAPNIISTVGKNQNTDVHFFNKFGKKVEEKLDCPPGIPEIECNKPTQFAVEVRSD